MEYERIHKLQTGMISPSKLRMKLLGTYNQKKKEESNNNSSRTSPSRMEDSEFVKNSLLAAASDGDSGEEALASSVELLPVKSDSAASDLSQGDPTLLQPKDHPASRIRMQDLVSKGDSSDSSSVHPIRICEDENLDYDSTSSFEFHKGERTLHHSVTRTFARQIPSKWNDAEKWIMNRQSGQSNVGKRSNLHNQASRASGSNMVRVAPESNGSENKPSVKRVDFVQPELQTGSTKFARVSHGVAPTVLLDVCTESKDLEEVDDGGFPCTKNVMEENTGAGVPAVRSVSMRDMGTEMTPIPSQEPSRSATPVSATSPLRSPTSSVPSTPRRGEPTPTPIELCISNTSHTLTVAGKKELSEQEQKLKIRREIVTLGVQLGKMNIAAWAGKEEKEKNLSGNENTGGDELEQIEYAKRAAAWEEAEKAKHAARFKREEIRIQAWESRQKAKLEAEMRKIEAQIEQMRAQAQAKMVKKIAVARRKSEEKRASAEASKNRMAEKAAAQAEYIRQTGRIPSSPFLCCGWS